MVVDWFSNDIWFCVLPKMNHFSSCVMNCIFFAWAIDIYFLTLLFPFKILHEYFIFNFEPKFQLIHSIFPFWAKSELLLAKFKTFFDQFWIVMHWHEDSFFTKISTTVVCKFSCGKIKAVQPLINLAMNFVQQLSAFAQIDQHFLY